MRVMSMYRACAFVLWCAAGGLIAGDPFASLVNAQTFNHSHGFHHHGSAGGGGWNTYYGGNSFISGYNATGVIAGGPYVYMSWLASPYWSAPITTGGPVFAPAGALFGPQAQFNQVFGGQMAGGGGFAGGNFPFGANAAGQGAGAANPPAAANNPQNGFGNAGNGAVPPARPRHSNEAALARAREQLHAGDERFHHQRFNEAYQRYKDAASNAPDMPGIYFRQGLALSALGQYSNAARVIRRGLELEPQWAASQFNLDELWQGNRMAKVAMREAMAEAALQRPEDDAVLFLLGVHLYFDGQRERSQTFFSRAAALNPPEAGSALRFLQEINRGQAANPPAGPRAI
ncbi:MAG: hypothetical protein JSS27_10875 [Planctomycetes bacterium]|nr:hypothetical protein [Planctomycetota bacterium]